MSTQASMGYCPDAQASPPAFKEVRSPGRTIVCPGAQASPPALLLGTRASRLRLVKKVKCSTCPNTQVLACRFVGAPSPAL